MSKDKEMPEKADLQSLDISAENRARLKQLFPSVFTETKDDKGELVESIDFEKLKAELGTFSDVFESRRERYGMDWPGKKDCMKLIQKSSIATLKPCREESVNFDDTENLFIEGDNLEVLKLLQKSYYGKIKMIYIDPPYNTGKEFIYPDDYSESLDTYLAYAGLIDDEGKKFTTQSTNEGRFHTRWLNMMYPRIYLARNLLREDGVICVSIDDNEMSNLRMILNDVFSEDNCLAELVWDLGAGTAAGHFTRSHEYILVYAKNKASLSNFTYNGDSDTISERAVKKISRGNPASQITFPPGIDFEGEDKTFTGTIGKSEKIKIVSGKLKCKNGKLAEDVTIEAGWAMRNQILNWLAGEDTYDTKGQKVRRFYFSEKGVLQYEKERGFVNPPSVLRQVASTKKGSEELIERFGEKVMDYPKPVALIEYLISTVCDDNDLIIDFFAGSCPLAESAFKTNISLNSNNRFICVQLPEKCNASEETGKNAISLGLNTVADIGKERIRRAIKEFAKDVAKKAKDAKADLLKSKKAIPIIDLGFKVLKLDKSNFKVWNGTEPEPTDEKLAKQLEAFVEHIDPKATQEDILFELLLKAGFKPTEKIEKKKFAGKTVFSIADGLLLICLEDEITKGLIEAIAEAEPLQFICLDRGFKGNDQLKANAVQTFAARNQGRDKQDQIVFRTV